MFTRSHLQELKRRYASMYAPPVEEEIEEHCGVCGEQGIEEADIEEGTSLQVKMALDDVGLKGTWKNGKVYVKKRDVKKAEKALKGNVIYRGKPPVVVGEEVEMDEAKGTAYPATVDTLRKIVKDKQNQVVMFKSGQARVDTFTASAIIAVYDGLKKPEHKKKLEDMIKTKEGFLKTQSFAMKMVK